jgi:hypothetical protein
MPENDCPGCRRDQDVTPERPELAEGRFSVLSLPKGDFALSLSKD